MIKLARRAWLLATVLFAGLVLCTVGVLLLGIGEALKIGFTVSMRGHRAVCGWVNKTCRAAQVEASGLVGPRQ